jgi:chromosome partitioning protein
MRVIAVANQKGGVGKTTTAVNLSSCLEEKGKRILLVDLDPQANATSALGIEGLEGLSIYESLLGHAPLVQKVTPTRFNHLFLIPSDLDLAGVEVEVARLDDHLIRLRAALQPLREDQTFDFVILDCPPSLGILMTNALAAADELLVPIQCEYFALEGLSKITHVIEQVEHSGANPGLRLGGIVMTMFDSRTNLSQQVVAEVKKHFGGIVYDTLIPRTVRLGEAPSFGKAIIEYDPSGAGARAYRALTQEFMSRLPRSLFACAPHRAHGRYSATHARVRRRSRSSWRTSRRCRPDLRESHAASSAALRDR